MSDTPDLVKLEAALREQLPADALNKDAAAYTVGNLMPSFLVSPATPEQLATVLKIADACGAGVIPGCAGTQMHLGMPPSRYDLALFVGRLNRVIEYEPADLTVTVEAGVPLAELQRQLAENGQWLPLDPPLTDTSSVGGMLATNASGPARYRYGSARDLLIGVTFALPNGELVKSGGRVVKNVAGYDLGKLQIGALGTLGVITQATFKVAPLPVRRELAAASGTLQEIMSITSKLADALLAVEGMVISREQRFADWRLSVRFAGGNAAVERSLRDFAAFVNRAGATPSSIANPTAALQSVAGSDVPLAVRASVLPTSLAVICEAFAAAGAAVTSYPAAGIVHGAWASTESIRASELTYLRRLCVETGKGALVVERAPIELKREVEVWGAPPASFDLMLRVKSELDPNGILNPGRYIGGI